MENNQLRKLQLYQLEILKEVDRICKKHDIKYYISWGTLLGAVRHKGFIPWDDDIDISLFWSDYVRFIDICAKELSEDFFLQNVFTEEKYFRTWSKIRINGTTSMDKILRFMTGVHWGICIDVFPIIPIPRKKIHQLLQKLLINFYTGLCFEPLLISFFKENKNLKFYQRFILFFPYVIVSVIPKKLKMQLKKYLIRKISQFKDKETPLCGEALSMNYEKSIVPKKMYGDPIRIEFEDTTFNAPENYIDYLINFYGDFMTLPQESERHGHGDTIIHFNHQANK